MHTFARFSDPGRAVRQRSVNPFSVSFALAAILQPNEERENLMSKPDYVAMTARNYKDADGKEKARWYEIGAAWRTKSGDGFNVTLNALPVDGSFSLFTPKAKPESASEA